MSFIQGLVSWSKMRKESSADSFMKCERMFDFCKGAAFTGGNEAAALRQKMNGAKVFGL